MTTLAERLAQVGSQRGQEVLDQLEILESRTKQEAEEARQRQPRPSESQVFPIAQVDLSQFPGSSMYRNSRRR